MSAIEAVVVGDREVATRLRAVAPAVFQRLAPVMRRLGIELQGVVKRDKLSGQVLKNRTGALRRSVGEVQDVEADGIAERVGIFGGPTVGYGRAHEFGFAGVVTIRAHLRMMVQAFGRPVASPHKILVRSYPRRVNLPERSYLRSALREFAPRLGAGIREVVAVVAREATA